MRIVADLTFLSGEYAGLSQAYFSRLFMEVAIRNPDHSFIFLSREENPPLQNAPPNVSRKLVHRKIFHLLGSRLWYRLVLPKLLARLGCDLFLAVDNFYGVTNKIPNCMFVINLLSDLTGNLENIQAKNTRIVRQTAKALQNTTAIITVSALNRQILEQQLSISPAKIKQIPLQADLALKPLSWEEKENVKAVYTKGLEYFIYAGDLHEQHQLLELLKAFSLFKKWQKSNMLLVITGAKTSATEQFLLKTHSYKYKTDLVVLPGLSEDTSNLLVGAAYAFVYPALYDFFPLNIVKAMQLKVPVITSPIPFIRSMFHDAVMYAAPNNAGGFSSSMQTIFKDEQFRSNLVETAQFQCEQVPRVDIADECWNFLKQLLQ